jgi:predicted RNA-binding protein with PIN domain
LEKAREELQDILSNYVGYTKTELILVYDAYLVKDGMGSQFVKDGYTVVFTKEDQTADAYIEKIMSEMGPNYNIRLVTADRLLQFSAVHSGIGRMTPAELESEIISVGNEIREFIKNLANES